MLSYTCSSIGHFIDVSGKALDHPINVGDLIYTGLGLYLISHLLDKHIYNYIATGASDLASTIFTPG